MNALMILVATAAVGVDVGWQPLSDGGVEYIIQIEPQLLDTLAKDHDLSSDLPTGLDVRRFRITVGTAQLPRIMPAAPPGAAAPSAPTSPSGPTGRTSSDGRRLRSAGPPPGALAAGPAGPPAAAYQPPAALPPASAPPSATLMGTPQPVPGATSPTQTPATPPVDAAPALSGPAVSGPTLTGPALSGPGEPATGSPEPPAVIADRVSQALDDPNAPGRSGAPGNTPPPATAAQPAAQPPRTLEPDPRSEQLADYTATPHETQRPNEPGEHADGHRYSEHTGAAAGAAPPAHETAGAAPKSPAGEPQDKPWGALITAVTLLVVSFSANIYLGWIYYESRLRYRGLLAQYGSAPAPV